MDVNEVANVTVALLSPALSLLMSGATEEASRRLSEGAWNKALTLWSKLRPQLEASPAARAALTDVASDPQEADAQAALRLQLKKILVADAALAAEVSQILALPGSSQTFVGRAGNVFTGNTTINGDVVGGNKHLK